MFVARNLRLNNLGYDILTIPRVNIGRKTYTLRNLNAIEGLEEQSINQTRPNRINHPQSTTTTHKGKIVK